MADNQAQATTWATKVRNAATWVTGPRSEHLHALADEIEAAFGLDSTRPSGGANVFGLTPTAPEATADAPAPAAAPAPPAFPPES